MVQKAYKDIADELSPSLAKFKAVGKPAPKPNYNSWLDDIKDYYDKQKKEFLKKDVKGRVCLRNRTLTKLAEPNLCDLGSISFIQPQIVFAVGR